MAEDCHDPPNRIPSIIRMPYPDPNRNDRVPDPYLEREHKRKEQPGLYAKIQEDYFR